jgi:outer membrane protein assembly factor BamA
MNLTQSRQNRLFLLIFCLFCIQNAHSQVEVAPSTPSYYTIDSISFEGLKKTRKSLILRELEYAIGDSFPAERLEAVVENNRLRALNLGIFSAADLTVRRITPDGRVALHLKVNESWYWYPSPVFELIDRNFNVWWTEFDRSLRRANYGLDYTQYNFTGRADQFNSTVTAGYNERFNLRYRTPWLNRDGTLGLSFGISYSRTHEAPIQTIGNKIDFRRDRDKYLIRRWLADAQLSWRPGLLTTHGLTLEYHNNVVADTIPQSLNFNFFLDGRTRQRFSSVAYRFNYDTRDIRPYPTAGWNIWVELRHNGLLPNDELRLARFKIDVAKYWHWGPRWSAETIGRLRTSLPRSRPPYINNQGLGYGNDMVRGYDYYVMDGLDFAVLRTTVRAKVVHRMVAYPKFLARRWSRLQPFEVRAYLTVLNDVGYANDPWYADQNPLTNRPLYGYGIGLDVVAFYNRVYSFSLMRTDTGEAGFFVRTRL